MDTSKNVDTIDTRGFVYSCEPLACQTVVDGLLPQGLQRAISYPKGAKNCSKSAQELSLKRWKTAGKESRTQLSSLAGYQWRQATEYVNFLEV